MTTSRRGRLVAPDLDDRRWADLVEEARTLIPTYAPQWTDHNPSGLGMTLVELFAFMTENLIYRLNRVPEKNYIAFLNLLGITRDPPTPAKCHLTFKAAPTGPPVVVVKGTQCQTLETEAEEPVVFETDEDVRILPVNLKKALLISKVLLNKYFDVSKRFSTAPVEGQAIGVRGLGSVQLCLGFDRSTTEELRLAVELFRPVVLDPVTATPQLDIEWLYSSGTTAPSSWATIAVVHDSTDGLRHNGEVRLSPPASWSEQNPSTWPGVPPASVEDEVTDPYHWIGVRITNLTTETVQIGIRHLLFNSVPSHNALTIPAPEQVGSGTGQPFQRLELAHQPMFKTPESDRPYDHVRIEVDGTPWSQADDFFAGPGEVYRLDPVTGEVTFGSYDAATGLGNGTPPRLGSAIAATSYRWVAGGTTGNVGAGTVMLLRTPVPGIVGVENLRPAFGASDEEPIETTKQRAPEALKNRFRAVTADDYDYLAREATTDVAIVKTLEPRHHLSDNLPHWTSGDPWMFGSLDRSRGNVNVIVVPRLTTTDPQPEPTTELLREVQRYLDARRDLTARLHVNGPRYLPIRVVANLVVWQSAIDGGMIGSAADVVAETEEKIEQFLHPTNGGEAGQGWAVGQNLFIADLFRAVMPDETLGYIATVTVQGQTPVYHFPPLGPGGAFSAADRPFALSTPGASVRLTDYELLCFGAHNVTATVAS